jgi:pimeloyl-ACP methyl ester carboxylesterase
VFAKSELPSDYSPIEISEATAMGVCFASVGYITVLADYLGYGDGTGVHPYLHAESAARVGRDMMKASTAAIQKLQAEWNKKLFIAGFSQGGQGALALVRSLEQDPDPEFHVTAAAGIAGPYDLIATIPLVLKNPTENSTAELAYMIAGLNPIYSFYQNMEEMVRPEYVSILSGLFDGESDWDDVVDALQMLPQDLVQPDFYNKHIENTDSAFMKAMRENEVYKWTPKTPIRLYHGRADMEVPFENSQIAYDYFKSQGANVELVNVGDVGHEKGLTLSLGEAVLWFETLRD